MRCWIKISRGGYGEDLQTNIGTKSETIVWQNTFENEGEHRGVFPFVIEVPTFPFTYVGSDLEVGWYIITTLRVGDNSYVAEEEIVLTQPEYVEVQNKLVNVSEREIAMLAEDGKGKVMVFSILSFLVLFATFSIFSLQIAPVIGGSITLVFVLFLFRKWKSQDALNISVEMERSVSPGECFPNKVRFTWAQLKNYRRTIQRQRKETYF